MTGMAVGVIFDDQLTGCERRSQFLLHHCLNRIGHASSRVNSYELWVDLGLSHRIRNPIVRVG